jgi:hypothetical protein
VQEGASGKREESSGALNKSEALGGGGGEAGRAAQGAAAGQCDECGRK